MAQVAFEALLKTFVTSRLDIKLKEIDLSAENRLATNGRAVTEAIEAIKEYGGWHQERGDYRQPQPTGRTPQKIPGR